MFDYDYFEELPEGEERLKYLKKCIGEADNEKDYELALDLRHYYIKESVFSGDCYNAVITFPEYMALFDKHSDKHDKLSFMIAFKWIIEDIGDFHQVTTEMAETYFEEFKKRCELYGYSLRTYYMKKMLFYVDSNPDKAKELHALFRQAERDDLSDCEACEVSHDVRMELRFGSEENAVAMLNDMKIRGISCGEVPEVTYGACIRHFTKIGELWEAEHYATLLMPLIKENDNFLMEVAHIILLKSLTNPSDAISIFIKYLETYIRSRNPKMKFYFEDAASRLFRSISADGHDTIFLRLPRSFSLYNDENKYSSQEVAEFFSKEASAAAEKFDKRNGDKFYSDMLAAEYPKNPTATLVLPQHSTSGKTPCVFGVPVRNEESALSAEQIVEKIKNVEGVEAIGYLQSEDAVVIQVRADHIESEFNIVVALKEIHENFNTFVSLHAIEEEYINAVKQDYKSMFVISMLPDAGYELDEAAVLMKICHAFNVDNSPAVLDLRGYRFFSAKWLKVVAENDVPLPGEAIYSIYPCMVSDGIRVTVGGLSIFGSRDLLIEQVKKENLSYVCRIMEQIAEYIAYVGKMPDENIEAEFGVVYNEETKVMFGWKTPNSVYGGSFLDYEDAEYAIPYISLTIDGKEEKLLLSNLTEEICEKLDFMFSHQQRLRQWFAACAIFRLAVDAMTEDDILICGFDADVPEKYCKEYGEYLEVIGKFEKNGTAVSGVIVSGVDEIPELSEGAEISIPEGAVDFWQIIRGGEQYFPDDVYMLI